MALLRQAYTRELKHVAHPNSLIDPSSRVERLLTVLSQLATLSQKQGAQTGALSHYTDAAILYQHMLRVCEKERKHIEHATYQAQREAIYKCLAQVRATMLAKARMEEAVASVEISVDVLKEEMARDKQELEILRADAGKRAATLEAIEMSDEVVYIEESRALFADIARGIRAFLARLYEENEPVLGSAPCKYTVIGLGSLALQQITPYSDIDFAILIEDDKSKETVERNREYFRQLSHLVNLRVINLGESIMRTSEYGVNFAPIGQKGVLFDLGGKTPLGRQDKYYDLIQPVKGMLYYLKNENQKTEHIDKALPFMLECTCYVHGDEELYKQYEEGKRAFLYSSSCKDSIPPHKARARQKLLEGAVEIGYGYTEGNVLGRRLQSNIESFAPKLDQDHYGRLYDVKQEIYRLPDRLIYELAMYYGLEPRSAWNAVVQLAARGIISQRGAVHLQYAASFASLLRLRAYLHYGRQKEEMMVLTGEQSEQEREQAVHNLFRLPPEALQEGGSLFKYYYIALPLHKKVAYFFEALNEEEFLLGKEEDFFREEIFYGNN